MKITLTTLLLSALFLLGCADTPISPIMDDNHSYQFIKLPKKSGMSVETSFSITKTINGTVGGNIYLYESYVAEDGHTVSIYVNLKVRRHSYVGDATITLTVDDEFADVSFTPAMVFDKPLILDLTFEGIDLTTVDYDFVFIDDDGTTGEVTYNSLHVNEAQGTIWVNKAKLDHFSRYGFVN
ncbi:MAG: hypothetical protein IH852_00590 [Bacteroidetes bacterium]|nr:hypothetical protein [Bacteroidota bacterium]MCH7962415.1 hypothetical protein [Bacteroidota bacterium]